MNHLSDVMKEVTTSEDGLRTSRQVDRIAIIMSKDDFEPAAAATSWYYLNQRLDPRYGD